MTTSTATMIPTVAEVEQRVTDVTVTAAVGGAGQVVLDGQATAQVELLNTSQLDAMEFRLGAEPWQQLAETDSQRFDVNLADTPLRVRRGGRFGREVRLLVMWRPAGVQGNMMRIVVSDQDPVDDDGRPDGTVWLKV